MKSLLVVLILGISAVLFLIIWNLFWDAENANGAARRELALRRWGFGRFGSYVAGVAEAWLKRALASLVLIGGFVTLCALLVTMLRQERDSGATRLIGNEVESARGVYRSQPLFSNVPATSMSDRSSVSPDQPTRPPKVDETTDSLGEASMPDAASEMSETIERVPEKSTTSGSRCGTRALPCSVAELLALFADRKSANKKYLGQEFFVQDRIDEVNSEFIFLRQPLRDKDGVKCKLKRESLPTVIRRGETLTVAGQIDKRGFSGTIGLNRCEVQQAKDAR